MNKLILVFASIFMLLVMSGCGQTTTVLLSDQTFVEDTSNNTNDLLEGTTLINTTEITTMSQLIIPSDINVINNIIMFNTVDQAEKYKIYIYNASDQLVGEYNITNGFDLSLLLSLGDYKMQLKATGRGFIDSNLSEWFSFSIINPNQVNQLKGEEMNNFQYVRWLGRTYYNQEEESKYFYFTASGFEVGFYGTELIVDLVASNFDDPNHQAYLLVLLDGEEDPTQGELLILDKSIGSYTLVEGLEYGYHTVKLLKRSEAIDSNTAVKSITTDGYFTTPPQAKTFNLQFIAASSSTGYGNLGSSTEAKNTANSDGLRAFAYLTSFLLDSEISIFSASGWGVSRGWNTSGDINEIHNIPNAYKYTAINDSGQIITEAGLWDISNYVPDVIVINLGTNDFTSAGYNLMSEQEQADLLENFMSDYVEFLLLLNNMHPQSKIIVAYGLMNENYYLEEPTLEVIASANQLIGQDLVYPFVMEGAGTHGNPYGSNSHPNVGTSMNVAEDLAAYISLIAGRPVVREMIE